MKNHTVVSALSMVLLLAGCDLTADRSVRDQTDADVSAQSGSVDTVVLNARVYIDGTSKQTASAFAIKDGVFVAVGEDKAVEALVSEETRVLNAEGRAIFPGLMDAHVHPFQGGEKALYMCNFPFSATPDELAATIAACADDPNAPEWIVGGQWNSNFFVDNAIASPRAFLDGVAGDHPVFLDDDSAHHGWANTRALELAGIPLTAETPDPVGGTFVRDADGIPNGVLLEAAAGIVSSIIPPYSPEQKVDAIAEASKIANSFGVTAVGEARTPVDTLTHYQMADQQGRLSVHALLYQQSFGHGKAPKPLESVAAYQERAEAFASPNTDAKAIKFFLDGVPTASRSAMMLEAYTVDEQHPHPTKGMQMIPSDVLFDAVAEFDRAGFRIKIHTAGDGSVQLALDAIAHARKVNGDSGLPISLAHAGYVAESDIPRFKALNAVADFTPYLWYPRPIIDSVVQAVGLPRGARYWPTKDLLAAGAPINGGSDWPAAAADMNPWPAIEALVTRRHPLKDEQETFWIEQQISLDEAISLWTTRPAAIMGMAQYAGSIEVGKSADFVILNIDPHEVAIEEVSKVQPAQTWFRGNPVFTAQ